MGKISVEDIDGKIMVELEHDGDRKTVIWLNDHNARNLGEMLLDAVARRSPSQSRKASIQ